jgi:hypothetical protein
MEKEIKIEYQPTIENLMKVSKYLLLDLPFVKYFASAFTVLFLFLNLSNLILNNKINIKDSMMQFGMIMIIWIIIYFSIISTIKKNILANKKNNEFQKITFNDKSYIQEGETFKIENFWNETFKIKETKSWFLIYQKKNTAFPIIKVDLKDHQYNELKALFNSLNIKKSLK